MHKDVYDEVLEKSIKLTKELTLGNTVDNTYMGPVINKNNLIRLKMSGISPDYLLHFLEQKVVSEMF